MSPVQFKAKEWLRDYLQENVRSPLPHGVLVIGTYDSLSDEQKKSFNYFRQGLFGLTVITFDELLHRLKQLYCFDEIDNSMAETTSTDFETGNPWQSW